VAISFQDLYTDDGVRSNMNMIATESGRFLDPEFTADGKRRARVVPGALQTVWLNTGTLCNLSCENCYIESTPKNDRLSYLSRTEVTTFLDEIIREDLPVREIGITGGEPFMNPHILGILEDCLDRGFKVLVLTNAMRPMMKCAEGLEILAERFGTRLTLRVSVDHFNPELHEEERGPRSWQPTIAGLRWLDSLDVRLHVAGRTRWGESEVDLRAGFQRLFDAAGIALNASADLLLFPEMDENLEVPEITQACWGILDVEPGDMMCASARMVVKRKGAVVPEVVACTLLPYSEEFSLGTTLAGSLRQVALNHPHCARFCVLGGGSCSG
jgi:sulfatase maturation enzyme AslB (radical SAM superfamily)